MLTDSIIMILSGIFILHFFGDFVFQTDRMAVNKSSSMSTLTQHVLVYTFTLIFMAFWMLPFITVPSVLPAKCVLWAAINGIIHFGVDLITSRAAKLEWERGDKHMFFVIIGLDQLVHLITLFGTFFWIVRP